MIHIMLGTAAIQPGPSSSELVLHEASTVGHHLIWVARNNLQ